VAWREGAYPVGTAGPVGRRPLRNAVGLTAQLCPGLGAEGGVELWVVEGLDDGGGVEELGLLLGVLDGVVLGVLDVAELVVGLGTLVVLDGAAGVVGTGEEVVVGLGVVAEVCDEEAGVFERVSGVWLDVVPTDAAGGEPGLWPPLRSTSTRAVASAAITATDNSPATSPAPPAPRRPSGEKDNSDKSI